MPASPGGTGDTHTLGASMLVSHVAGSGFSGAVFYAFRREWLGHILRILPLNSACRITDGSPCGPSIISSPIPRDSGGGGGGLGV